MKMLTRYVLFPRGRTFVLQLTDESGATSEYRATPAQLEALIDDAEELLDQDDSDAPS